MADPVTGILEVKSDPGGQTRIVIDPNAADITAGGNGGSGDVLLKDGSGKERVRLGSITESVASPDQPTPTVIASYTGLRIKNGTGANLVQVGRVASSQSPVNPPHEVLIVLGGDGLSGTVQLVDGDGKTRLLLGRDGTKEGRIVVRSADGHELLGFDSSVTALYIGGQGNEGDLILRNGSNQESIKIDGGDSTLTIKKNNQSRIRLEGGNAWLGGNGEDGDVVLFATGGDNQTLAQRTIHLNGGGGTAALGGSGTNGQINLQATNGKDRIRLQASQANIWLGGNGADGDLVIFKNDGDNQTSDKASIHLDGQAGDIILRNADCAEEFDVLEAEAVEPGTVMVIDGDGALKPGAAAYDRRVAGVISGAGTYKPGILLDRQASPTPRMPVALAGKVYCKVDAQYGSVGVGDLLTTSPTLGHAMRAGDPMRAFGSVIGKALRPLESGRELIPILVALQ